MEVEQLWVNKAVVFFNKTSISACSTHKGGLLCVNLWNNIPVFKDIVPAELDINHWWTWTLGRSAESHPEVYLQRETHLKKKRFSSILEMFPQIYKTFQDIWLKKENENKFKSCAGHYINPHLVYTVTGCWTAGDIDGCMINISWVAHTEQ